MSLPKKILCVCVLCLLCTSYGVSQSPPNVIPPSPNAAAFAKYGNIPVSTYTGIPTISIPIASVVSGDITFPIDLSYHASGVRVAEEASKVGLGWVLNSGGMISRSIVNGDDFENGTGYYSYHTNEDPELLQFSSTITDQLLQYGRVDCDVTIFGNTFDPTTPYDGEPDQYNYSLPNGKSGKFILRRDRQPILAKDEKISIEVDDEDANSWTIKTSDGFTYEFDTFESYYGNELINEFGEHKTAWYLTRIVSPKGYEVRFKYTVSNNYVKTLGSFGASITSVVFGTLTSTTPPSNYTGCQADPNYGAASPGREYTNVQIDSIVYVDGFVKFNYEGREDIVHDERIAGVEVYALAPDQVSYQLIKSTQFRYDYFLGTTDRDYQVSTVDFERKRLKLKEVVERRTDNIDAYRYKFDYKNENDAYPYKTSFARDHWGYYNGRTSNSSLIPTFTPVTTGNTVRTSIGVMGNERDANQSQVSRWILDKITYPTGGVSEFEYESNDFDVEESLDRDNSFFAYNPQATTTSDAVFRTGSVTGTYPADFEEALEDGNYMDFRDAYVDPGASSSPVSMSAFFIFSQSQEECNFGNQGVVFELVRENGSVYSSANIFELLNSPTPPSAACVGQTQGLYTGIKYENTYSLPPGRYYWRVTIPQGVTLFSGINANFTFLKTKKGIDYGGGLRIKRIKEYASAGDQPTIRRFDYHFWEDRDDDGTDEEYSYGKRMANPSYSYFSMNLSEECVTFGLETVCGVVVCENLKRSSESNVSLAIAGTAVGYDKVTVYYGENGENGKTEFTYHNLADKLLPYQINAYIAGSQLTVPRRPPSVSSIPDEMNGLPIEQTEYKHVNDSTYEMLSRTTTTYHNGHLGNSRTVWSFEARHLQSSVSMADQCFDLENVIYPALQVNWIYPETIVEETFDGDVDNPVKKTTTNTYASTDHYLITSQAVDLEDKIIYTSYKYPLDYDDEDSSPALLLMKGDLFNHSAIVETKVTQNVGGTITGLSQSINEFGIFNDSMALPKSAWSYKLEKPLATNFPIYLPIDTLSETLYQKHFDLDYTSQGEIKKINKPNNISVAYVWGHKGNLPIAEVKNAEPGRVFFTSFEGEGEGNSQIDDCRAGHFSRTNGFSKNLNNLTPGEYLLSYWTKSGNEWAYNESTVSVSGTTYTISLANQVDDVRFHPSDAQMTTYTYDVGIGVSTVTDANGNIVRYEYDGLNRLKLIRDNKGRIVKTFKYHYQK